ncbi:insulin gene enhancer protein isl-1-like [Diaphorina citri]|uniref:Insulin gene enhancer protein isl-1-like n=1 Tax=Diaphorina citri TaxID=121845 RepID=A0A3Q0IJ55_DIACI|nr:insulin gene enhancer protein isl-1-like [Diaphorina citri]
MDYLTIITMMLHVIVMMSCANAKKRRLSLCVGCGGQIHDQYILRVAPDLEWHAACLRCAECHQFLDENCTCFVRDGKTYCKRDYVRLFGTKCEKCNLNFKREDFVMRAKNKIYHVQCFCCVVCGKQLVPGDEFALREDGLFCKDDHEGMDKSSNGENNNNNTNINNNLHNLNNEGSNSGKIQLYLL